MQIPWMARDEIAQAIPPAYTRLIGEHLLSSTFAPFGIGRRYVRAGLGRELGEMIQDAGDFSTAWAADAPGGNLFSGTFPPEFVGKVERNGQQFGDEFLWGAVKRTAALAT